MARHASRGSETESAHAQRIEPSARPGPRATTTEAGAPRRGAAPTDAGRARRTNGWTRFVAWRRNRPFVGSVLTMLAGIEMFFSGQLDLGNIKVQVGVDRAAVDHHPRRHGDARDPRHDHARASDLLRRDRAGDLGVLAHRPQPRRILRRACSSERSVAFSSCPGCRGAPRSRSPKARKNPRPRRRVAPAKSRVEPRPLAHSRSLEAGAEKQGASRSRRSVSGAVVACFILAVGGIGAARVPSGDPRGCASPSLRRAAPHADTHSDAEPAVRAGPGGSGLVAAGTCWAELPRPAASRWSRWWRAPDPSAPTMTLPAAQLGGSSLSLHRSAVGQPGDRSAGQRRPHDGHPARRGQHHDRRTSRSTCAASATRGGARLGCDQDDAHRATSWPTSTRCRQPRSRDSASRSGRTRRCRPMRRCRRVS